MPIIDNLKRTALNIILSFICIILFSSCGYKNLVVLEDDVNMKWSNVENDCMERMDVAARYLQLNGIDNLEDKRLIVRIKYARNKALEVSKEMNPENLNQSLLNNYEDAQLELNLRVKEINAEINKDPYIRTDPEWIQLKSNMKHIDSSAYRDMLLYNNAAIKYNDSRQNPWRISVAKFAGLQPVGYFQKMNVIK